MQVTNSLKNELLNNELFKIEQSKYKYKAKINKIRKERMQTQFYTGSAKFVPTSSTQATNLRFSFLFVNSFTTSEPHRDNTSLVFGNSYNLRDP